MFVIAKACCHGSSCVICRVKKVTSENDISGLHPATPPDFKQTVGDKRGQPSTQATTVVSDQSEPDSTQQVSTIHKYCMQGQKCWQLVCIATDLPGSHGAPLEPFVLR